MKDKSSSDKGSSPPFQHPPLGGSPPAPVVVAMMTAQTKKKCKLNDDDDVSLTDVPDDNEEVRHGCIPIFAVPLALMMCLIQSAHLFKNLW
jgi:hypothetical protein